MHYDLVRERKIEQSYQFGMIGVFGGDMVSTERKPGRPTLSEIINHFDDGATYLWLYTRIDDEPELCDGIDLSG